jgi:proline utilization trans-activator
MGTMADVAVNDIYGLPGRVHGTFVQRVHGILKELRAWDHALPEDIRSCTERSPRHVASLHLAYNQLIITTTRPILLHIFKSKFLLGVKSATPRSQGFSTTTLALAEACINAARASSSILTRLFIDGSIATFGYLDAHHLFSSTLILIMSAVMSPSVATSEAVQLSSNVLRAMRDHGNIPAGDYCDRLSQIQSSVSNMRAEVEKNQLPDIFTTAAPNPNPQPDVPEPNENDTRPIHPDQFRMYDMVAGAASPRQQLPYMNFDPENGNMDALAHPLIEDFLGGDWLAWSGGTFPEDDALRAVALELDDNRIFNS